MVGDRDAVGGDEQSDHDLGAVPAVIAAVAEGLCGKALRGPFFAFEVGGGEVITDKAQIEVRKIAQLGEQMGLDLVFCVCDGVEASIEPVERRGASSFGQGRVGPEPVVDTPALGGRIRQPVGDHGEDRVAKSARAPTPTDALEQLVQQQPGEVGVTSGHRPIRRC